MVELVDLNLKTFFSGLNASSKSIEEVRKIYNPQMAFEFNSFEFWWDWVNENKVSEILAYFLNPKESHGQGSIFIELFLKIIFKNNYNEKINFNEDISIKCEKGTKNYRRLDISIDFGNKKYGIAIENKIWARDQFKQLNDYNEYLKNAYKENYCLLYVKPYGEDPSEDSISKDQLNELKESDHLKILSYSEDIIPIIKEWGIHCQAIRVRSFLQDFEQYLKQEITGEKIMNEFENIIEYCIKQENIKLAFAITNAMEEIKKNFFETLKKQMIDVSKENNKLMELKINSENWDDGFGFKKETYFYFKVKTWRKCCIGIGFDKSYANDFVYGICSIDGDIKFSEIFRSVLKKKLGNTDYTELSDVWPWVDFFPSNIKNWGNNYEPWLMISNGKLKSIIKDKIEKIQKSLERIDL